MNARWMWLASSVLVTVMAHAGPDEERAAREYNQAAVDAFKARDFVRARDNFEHAFELARDPKLRINLAVVSERLDDLDAARTHYQAFLRENPRSDKVVDVKLRLADLEKKMKRWGNVVVTITPEPAEAMLGPRQLRAYPASTWLEPGRYWLDAALPGHVPLHERVVVRPGTRSEAKYSLVPNEAPRTESASAAPEPVPASTPETSPAPATVAAAPAEPAPAPPADGAAEQEPTTSPSIVPWALRGVGAAGLALGGAGLVVSVAAAAASAGIWSAWQVVVGLDRFRMPLTVGYYGGYITAALGTFIAVGVAALAVAVLVGSFVVR